jgi:hypothetical protein
MAKNATTKPQTVSLATRRQSRRSTIGPGGTSEPSAGTVTPQKSVPGDGLKIKDVGLGPKFVPAVYKEKPSGGGWDTSIGRFDICT